MSAKTGIAWTDSTWNPIRGCSRVSEGCRNCYAERVAVRAENAKLREALGMMSTAAPRTVVDSLRPIEWAIAVVEEVQAERDDRDKLRERIALLEDLCRKAVDPCVSYWMVVEPGIRTALACKETHND